MSKNKIAVVTRGAKGIGKAIAREFRQAGAAVYIMDLLPNDCSTGDIAQMALFLCSEKAGFITSKNICIDGGTTRQIIYHNDFGWELQDNT